MSVEKLDTETKQWINTEMMRLQANEDWTPNKQEIERIIETWRQTSPKMFKRLDAENLTESLAKVVQAQAWQMQNDLLAQGYPPTDAREIAERECLMLEPEENEEEEVDENEEPDPLVELAYLLDGGARRKVTIIIE